MNRISHLIHRIAHFFGLNGGYCDHEKDEHGAWWFGFRCAGCGELQDKRPARGQDCIHRNVTVTEDGGRCNDCRLDLSYNASTRNWEPDSAMSRKEGGGE